MKHFNRSLIQKNESLLLAVSGGIDSMVLLHVVNELKHTQNIKIAVAYFDHQKRKESFLDQQLVVETCKKLSIHCYVGKLEEQSTENFHQYAREKRYAFFIEIARKIQADKIVLAHHLNDQAETILMRLTRGTSFEGYRGILPRNTYHGMEIIRPMLDVSKAEILQYQKEHAIPFNEDASNLQDDYTRNRFRHHMLPLLEEENPKYLEKFQQFSQYQSYAYEFIEEHALNFIQQHTQKIKNKMTFKTTDFKSLKPIIQMEVVKRIANLITENSVELSFTNIEDLIALCLHTKPHIEYPYNEKLYVSKSYQLITFSTHKDTKEDYEFIVNDFSQISLPNGNLVIITKNPNKYYGNMFKLCYNNLDFHFPLTIRNRRAGDKINTSYGTKKLKDIFINKKIPMAVRNEVPILLNRENEILWVPEVFNQKTSGRECIYIIYQGG